MNPDRLAELEEERRFLLRSLDDLEREYEAGDVDDVDYETLKDGYVSRAASVLRSIEEGRAALPQRRPVRWGRIVLGAAVVALAAGITGWLVARESGQRLPGQVITGGLPDDSISAKLAQARSVPPHDPVSAITLYDEVLAIDPDHPEALTYRSWRLVTALASSDQVEPEVRDLALSSARASLRMVIDTEPAYADAHCYYGAILLLFDDDGDAARPQLEECIELRPPATTQNMAEALLGQLDSGVLPTAPSETQD